jgi:hypothetical protein
MAEAVYECINKRGGRGCRFSVPTEVGDNEPLRLEVVAVCHFPTAQ